MKKSQLKELIREILAEVSSTGLSGFKKSPESKENTQMGVDDKTLTSTTEPSEKEESKKLPVVKKPAAPEIVKEERNYLDDMQRELNSAIKAGDAEKILYYHNALKERPTAVASFDKQFKGSWAYETWKKKYEKQIDALKKKFPPQTSAIAESTLSLKDEISALIKEAVDEYRTKGALGANNAARTAPLKKYVPKGITGMGRPKKDVGSIITVAVNGEPVGEFDLDLKTPSGKPDMSPGAMKRHVQQFYDENQLQEFGFISPEMVAEFEKLSDQWVDGALADNATLDLTIEPGNAGEQVLKPKTQ